MDKRFLLFGLGFSGRVVARSLAAQGWTVIATTRSGLWRDRIDADAGISLYPFDRHHPLPEALFQGVSHVLSTIPPDDHGDPVLDGIGALLGTLSPVWAGYFSTTGVYGDHGGGWVDEGTPATPAQERSRRRLAAEQAWLASGLPVHLFRLAGIYGPGRSALETVRSGTARRIVKPGQMFSRIHVEDLAQVVLASMAHPRPGVVYNVCDDDAAPPQEVIDHACALLNLPPVPELSWDEALATLSPMALSFFAENKRVRNDLIKTELGVRLRYPSYRDGLASMLT